MTSEASSSEQIVMQNSRNIMPARPPDRPIGRKTATVVRVEAEMDSATSFAPSTQDSRRSKPSAR